ncbi:MAG: hypothetical protein ACP5E4_02635 [Candidatus Aenigmatarchaeota archaeon]
MMEINRVPLIYTILIREGRTAEEADVNRDHLRYTQALIYAQGIADELDLGKKVVAISESWKNSEVFETPDGIKIKLYSPAAADGVGEFEYHYGEIREMLALYKLRETPLAGTRAKAFRYKKGFCEFIGNMLC